MRSLQTVRLETCIYIYIYIYIRYGTLLDMDSPRTPKSTSLSAELKELIDKRNMLTTRTRMKVLSALDELHHENSTRKEQSLRAQTIQEILSSEVKYLRQLEVIKEFFMIPIQERKLLDQISHTTLFENIETLYNVNGELLKKLRENPDNVAQAFCKLAPFFKLYSVYAYNYKRALVLLQEIQQNNQMAAEFISNQETRPEVNNKLPSLLIAPIQRIPRYKLLLKEVIRHTPPRQKEYNELQASLVEIEKVVSHINTLVGEYEDTQKLLELQKHIVGRINLIKPGRKLIRQGPLMRVSRGGNTSFRRHFILLSDTLLYCKGDPENSLAVCCLLPLNKCKVERVLSNRLFKVVCMQETLLLYSENGDSEDWIQVLQDAVKKYIECRQTLRKDSSSRMPMRKIIRFDSDDIARRRKRKRPLSVNDPVDANSSGIIYINRDTESENSAEGSSSFFLALKRFKRGSVEIETQSKRGSAEVEIRSKRGSIQTESTPINDRIRSWIDGMKRKNSSNENSDDNNFFHQTKNTAPLKTACENPYLTSSLTRNDYSANDKNYLTRTTIQGSNNSNTQTNERSLSFRTVGKFFSLIGNTFKDIFNRN